ncbi:unnamed protein product [Commensalibacter communis]|nr:hypothetical protein [Commensalibacter communis]CAI3949970.1 unnamed protein product [Commensalibacter communis]CAI3954771.1 unnamed protein product [Commensalibacter communis]CAI3957375.1 unnamed protein product [Commensalibacter communis]CAI3958880.1 unnamed protein product [Commensalibacter communis]
MFETYLFLCIPLILLLVFIGLIIRLFFSPHKKIILLTLFLMVAGFILFCIGMLPIIAAGASASGGGHSSGFNYDPGLYFLLSCICALSVVPLSIYVFFKK